MHDDIFVCWLWWGAGAGSCGEGPGPDLLIPPPFVRPLPVYPSPRGYQTQHSPGAIAPLQCTHAVQHAVWMLGIDAAETKASRRWDNKAGGSTSILETYLKNVPSLYQQHGVGENACGDGVKQRQNVVNARSVVSGSKIGIRSMFGEDTYVCTHASEVGMAGFRHSVSQVRLDPRYVCGIASPGTAEHGRVGGFHVRPKKKSLAYRINTTVFLVLRGKTVSSKKNEES